MSDHDAEVAAVLACPRCNGERGGNVRVSSAEWEWRECGTCNGTGMHTLAPLEVVNKARCIQPEKVGMTGLVVTCDGHTTKHPRCALAALTAKGIRCLYVPEGVEVEHGARLVPYSYYTATGTPAYAIEDSP